MKLRPQTRVLGFVIIVVQLLTLLPLDVMAQAPSIDAFTQGRDAYRDGNYDAAVAALKPLIGQTAAGSRDWIEACALLARCQVRLGDQETAKHQFVAILERDSTWRADPDEFKDDEVHVFQSALVDYRARHAAQTVPTPLWKQKRFYIPGALVVLGTAVVFAFSHGKDNSSTTTSSSLPNPPDPPARGTRH